MKNKSGQSVLEVILAAAVFMFFSASSIGLVLQALSSNRLGLEETVATQYTVEGLEAVRSIKNQSFSNLNNTLGIGISKTADVWAFSGTENIFDNRFHRSINIADVYRDTSGNVVYSGGTLDSLSKKITVTTNWNFTSVRQNSVVLSTYLSDWRKPFGRGGMLVYGDGGTSNDAIRYRTFDGSSWSPVGNLADIDSATINKYLRSVRVFSTQNRNEKIVVSRHYNGSANFIYAQVFNGSSWGNVQLLSSWSSTSYLDMQPFDGTYMSNGNFVIFYSDYTSTIKYRVWTGTAWTGQYSLPTGANIPNSIVAKVRPNTKEIMVASLDQSKYTSTSYFNGSDVTLSSNWTRVVHGTACPDIAKRIIDFDWSPNNPLQGALVYSESSNDRGINVKIFTANGSGGGSWSSTANSSTVSNLGALSVSGRQGANEFMSCVKDSSNDISCFESSNSPSWTKPSNNVLTANTQTGIQRSFHFGYENSGNDGLAVYSDNTTIAKARKYNPSTNSFDSSPVNVGTLNNTASTVRLIPNPASDDILVLMGSSARSFYSIFWNGSNNNFYGNGDQGFMLQGNNGSNLTDYWYDFTWD